MADTKVDILEDKECEKILKIEVPKDRVLVEIENMYSNLMKVAEVPGFRIGKAPRSVIEKFFKARVEKDVLEKLVADSYLDALKQIKINPINYPDISELKFEAGKPLEFKAKVEIKPEVKLGTYKGIKVKKEPVEIKPEEIDNTIKYLQERNAEFTPVEGREIVKGDFVLVDFAGFGEDGQEIKNTKTENYTFEAGSGRVMPEIDNGLTGAKNGDTKEITIEYKKDFANKEMAGKKIVYKVAVKGIREKKLPELNDEFAKTIGDFKNMEEVKKNIGDGIKKDKENKEKVRVTNTIIDEIVKNTKFPVPKSLVLGETETLIKDFEARMQQQGVTYETVGKTKEQVEKEYTEIAEKRVRGFLVLDKISEVEKIDVTDQDVDNEINAFIIKSGKEADSWREYLSSEKGRSNVRGQLRQDKVLDFLYKEAKIE